MAILTPLDLHEARALGELFGLEVTAVRGLLAGSVNSNFELTATSGRFFLRVYEEQGVEGTAREARLLRALKVRGVPSPEPRPRVDGAGYAATHARKPVVVFPFLPGRTLAQREVTPHAMAEVGAALAKVHAVGDALSASELDAIATASRFDRSALVNRLDHLPSELSADVVAARERLRAFFRTEAPKPSAIGLIHGDLFRDNVLFEGERIVALLDFESASVGSIAFDIMVTMLAWCVGDQLDLDLARALLRGYTAVRSISDEAFGGDAAQELHAQGLEACARFATTRITDFELRPKGSGIYKDFRRFLARMDAIEAMGPSGIRALLPR